jgi:RHS repeat-associated protein
LLEALETRQLLAGDFQNPAVAEDVDASGFVTNNDLLEVVQDLRTFGNPHILTFPPPVSESPPFVDVNGDDVVDPFDLLRVVTSLRDGVNMPQPSVMAALLNDTGTNRADHVTGDANIAGRITSGLTDSTALAVRLDGGLPFRVALNAMGEFAFDAAVAGLAQGPHTVQLFAQNKGGPVGQALAEFSLVTDSLVFDPVGPLTVMAGASVETLLTATAPEGRKVAFSLDSETMLPSGQLRADNVLAFSPTAAQTGEFTFDVIARDGVFEARQTVSLEVVGDPVTTTRLSGVVMNTAGEPLDGLPLDLGPLRAVTDAEGRFTFDVGTGAFPAETLKIRGELRPGAQPYPFVAEPLPLLLGREPIAGMHNRIERPIFLPVLDVAGGTQVDPAQDTLVRQEIAPGEFVEIMVKAGTLLTPQGELFEGVFSITEVPLEFTPAAMPADWAPSLVITTQPAEMIFSEPARVTFPNRGRWAPGFQIDLWFVSPVTGDFQDVGDMVVSADGLRVETVSGGIRNTSWGTDTPPPPPPNPSPDSSDCDPCKEGGGLASDVSFATGAVTETHDLTTYRSLGESRGVSLTYDSLRADPRPIAHAGYDDLDPNVISILPDGLLIEARFAVEVNGVRVAAPGFDQPGQFGFRGGENFFDIPTGSGPVDVGLQIDLRQQPTGVYQYSFSSGIRNRIGEFFVGASQTQRDVFTHVNAMNSPFGTGWGLDGLKQIVEGAAGAVAIVDGDGTELLYRPAQRRDFFLQGIFPNNPLNNTVLRYNGRTGELIGPFVASGAGGLSQPHNPTFGPNGDLYVVSGGTQQVLRYDGQTGEFLEVFVDQGEGGFAGTAELAFDGNGNLNAPSANGVHRYDAAGQFIDAIAGPADGVQQACGIEFGPDGNLYVYDTFDEQMRRFNPQTGALIDVFIPGGNLANACDFDFGPDGDIFITDATFRDVRRFSGVDGSFLGVFATTNGFPSGITLGPDGDFYVNVSGTTQVFDGETGELVDTFIANNGGFGNFGPAGDAADESRFVSPPGDFSTLEKLPNGTYRNTRPDQTVYQFNENHQLATVTDRQARVTTYNYDAGGNLTTITDPVGFATTFAYTSGRVRTITDPANRVTQFDYDAAGNLQRITDPDGSARQFAYDDRHLMIQETTPRGFVEQINYDEFGRATAAVLPDGSQRTITPRQVRGVYPVGATVDPFNPPSAIRTTGGDSIYTDANGNVVRTVLDREGQALSSTDGVGALPVVGRDPATNLVTQATDGRGNVSTFTYDDRGNLLTVQDGISVSQQFTYDQVFNRVLSYTDALGRQTLYERDPATGNTLSVTQVVGPLGGGDDRTVHYTYNAQNLLATVTDPRGVVYDYGYDPMGQLTRIMYARGSPDEATRRFEYDAAGNVNALVDERGHRTEFTYDAQNRLTRLVEADPDGAGPLSAPVTQYAYDTAGNLTQVIDRGGAMLQFEYDSRNNLERVIDHEGRATNYTYDGEGNVLSATDPLGAATHFVYDARNRLVMATDPDGVQNRVAYNLDDNLTSITDPLGNVTQFEYDARNRLVRRLDPLGHAVSFSYDAADRLIGKTDRLGRNTQYAFDDLDRMVRETWVGPGTVFEYAFDPNNNLLSASDGASSLTVAYDERNRVASIDNLGTLGVLRVVLGYTYDDEGNVLSRSDSINGVAAGLSQFTYDAQSRLTQIVESGAGVSAKRVNFHYDPLSRFTAIERFADAAGTQPVVASAYTYNSLNLLESLTHSNQVGEVAFYDLEYDPSYRIAEISRVDGVVSYGYDELNQLVSADNDATLGLEESYQYDANGNRTASHLHDDDYTTGASNRLTSDGTFAYEYDAEGNLTRRTLIASGDRRDFAWDHRNRLIAVTDRDENQTVVQTVEFAYDALNRRIAKTVTAGGASETTHFVYDFSNILLEFHDADAEGPSAAQLQRRYLYGPAVDQVMAEDDGAGNVLWYLNDHQGTVRDVVDSAGNLVNHLSYDAFGNLLAETDPNATPRYGYTGRELDEELGLYYYRSRYYDPALARYISEDPIGFHGGDPNLYRYVGNQPVSQIDPSGQQASSYGDYKGYNPSDSGDNFNGGDAFSPGPGGQGEFNSLGPPGTMTYGDSEFYQPTDPNGSGQGQGQGQGDGSKKKPPHDPNGPTKCDPKQKDKDKDKDKNKDETRQEEPQTKESPEPKVIPPEKPQPQPKPKTDPIDNFLEGLFGKRNPNPLIDGPGAFFP